MPNDHNIDHGVDQVVDQVVEQGVEQGVEQSVDHRGVDNPGVDHGDGQGVDHDNAAQSNAGPLLPLFHQPYNDPPPEYSSYIDYRIRVGFDWAARMVRVSIEAIAFVVGLGLDRDEDDEMV